MKKGLLSGIKILDFSQVLSAPFCGMLLADMGAEIIKIERPGTGDISREYGPYVNDVSLYYCQYNRGKKGIAIDMRSEDGKKIVMDLVSDVDIVIENFKAGTLEKLGLGFEKMREINPNLIYGSISGFGTYGPLSHLPCMDIIAAARSGLVAQTGSSEDAPIKPGFSLCDTWAGLQLLRGLSMALLYRQREKRALRVDIAMLDSAFYMCEAPLLEHSITGVYTERSGNHHPWYAPNGEFPAKDGNVVIATSTEKEWQALCRVLGADDLAYNVQFSSNQLRVKNRDELNKILGQYTEKIGRYELEKRLVVEGVPCSAVQSLMEFDENPQTKKLGIIVSVQQKEVGTSVVTNTPIYFSETPVQPDRSAPARPGYDSREILTTIGYSREKIDQLYKDNVIA